MAEPAFVHDEEIDSAIKAVRNPAAPYSPEAVTLAAAVLQLRKERDEVRAELQRFQGNADITRRLVDAPSAVTTDPFGNPCTCRRCHLGDPFRRERKGQH